MCVTYNFKGQTVLITGATKGIGLKIAEDFCHSGAHLILTGTSEESFNKVQSRFKSNLDKVEFIPTDFLNDTSFENFLKVIKKYKKIDILVNNAGINRINYIDETNLKDWDDLNSVNLKRPFQIIRAVSEVMKQNNYGRIINIGSIFGKISKAKRSIYSATKHGLHGLTIASALDLGPYGILVNTVSPGFVMTDLTTSILSGEEIKELSESVPIKRFAQPSEISSIVLFLSSKNNSFLTSQNIIVDGGFTNV